MAPSAKPPTSLKISIQMLGNPEARLDLFTKLEELGFLERSQDIVLNVGYYFEEDGRVARDKAEALLRDHPAVMKTKSFTDLGTKRKVSDTFESEAEAGDDEETDEDDELPMDALLRSVADLAPSGGVEEVTLTHIGPGGQRGRSVTLTAETRKRAAEALQQMQSGE